MTAKVNLGTETGKALFKRSISDKTGRINFPLNGAKILAVTIIEIKITGIKSGADTTNTLFPKRQRVVIGSEIAPL